MTPIGGTLFQLGYVTRDLGAAMALYRARYGIRDYLRHEIPYPGSDEPAQVALAYRGGLMIELTEPAADAYGIFGDVLSTGSVVALHHLGHAVPDQTALRRIVERYEADGYRVPLTRTRGRDLTVAYVDTRRDNGHYTEFVVLGDTARALLDRVPRN